jgi:hypothetical protein
MVKVMVSYLMSDAHKFMTALILAAYVLVCANLVEQFLVKLDAFVEFLSAITLI